MTLAVLLIAGAFAVCAYLAASGWPPDGGTP